MGASMMWVGLLVTALAAVPALGMWKRHGHEHVMLLALALALEYGVGSVSSAALQGMSLPWAFAIGTALAVLLFPTLLWLARRAYRRRAERVAASSVLQFAQAEAVEHPPAPHTAAPPWR